MTEWRFALGWLEIGTQHLLHKKKLGSEEQNQNHVTKSKNVTCELGPQDQPLASRWQGIRHWAPSKRSVSCTHHYRPPRLFVFLLFGNNTAPQRQTDKKSIGVPEISRSFSWTMSTNNSILNIIKKFILNPKTENSKDDSSWLIHAPPCQCRRSVRASSITEAGVTAAAPQPQLCDMETYFVLYKVVATTVALLHPRTCNMIGEVTSNKL